MNTDRPGRNQKLISLCLRAFVVKPTPNSPRRHEDAKNHEEFSISRKILSKNAEENSFQPVKDFALVATVAAPPQPNLALRLRSLAVKGWASLARVVKDDAKSVARSPGDGAGSVAHVSLIVSPAPRHRPPGVCENHYLALSCDDGVTP